MQIVIEIDEKLYNYMQTEEYDKHFDKRFDYQIRFAVKDGIPVQKGHKIIDAWALQEHLALVPMEDRIYREAVEIIDRFPSITEADRSEEDG